jgi:hypothetical protein
VIAAIKATIKTNPVAIIALGTALLIQTGCSKAEQTKAERLKQIDAQFANCVATGRPEDAPKRGALKAERAVLVADLGYSTSTVMRPVTRSGGYAISVKADRWQRV